MKKIFLVFILLVAGSVVSSSDGKKGGTLTFNCVVKDQVILQIEDGVPQRYSHYSGELKTGDRHTITLEWFDLKGTEDYDYSDGKNKLRVIMDGYRASNRNWFISRLINYLGKETFLANALVRGEFEPIDLVLRGNGYDLHVGNSIITDEESFSLKRYYKNDWDYFHQTSGGQTLVSNCMNSRADINKFIEGVISIFERSD
jgi:hypothetical protein